MTRAIGQIEGGRMFRGFLEPCFSNSGTLFFLVIKGKQHQSKFDGLDYDSQGPVGLNFHGGDY